MPWFIKDTNIQLRSRKRVLVAEERLLEPDLDLYYGIARIDPESHLEDDYDHEWLFDCVDEVGGHQIWFDVAGNEHGISPLMIEWRVDTAHQNESNIPLSRSEARIQELEAEVASLLESLTQLRMDAHLTIAEKDKQIQTYIRLLGLSTDGKQASTPDF